MMGIAALHPSYRTTAPRISSRRSSLSISRYKPCSHSNSFGRGGDLWSAPTKLGIAEEIEPDGGSSKITRRGPGRAADMAGRNLSRAEGRRHSPGGDGAGRRPQPPDPF